jgi:hypothetical protein
LKRESTSDVAEEGSRASISFSSVPSPKSLRRQAEDRQQPELVGEVDRVHETSILDATCVRWRAAIPSLSEPQPAAHREHRCAPLLVQAGDKNVETGPIQYYLDFFGSALCHIGGLGSG